MSGERPRQENEMLRMVRGIALVLCCTLSVYAQSPKNLTFAGPHQPPGLRQFTESATSCLTPASCVSVDRTPPTAQVTFSPIEHMLYASAYVNLTALNPSVDTNSTTLLAFGDGVAILEVRGIRRTPAVVIAGLTKALVPSTKAASASGVWSAWEIVLVRNTPGKRDGRVTLYNDGVLVLESKTVQFADRVWDRVAWASTRTLRIDRVYVSGR